ncbi:hypothetical protein PoB_004569400 [Plakobranchus ocellatus]|uniref:Uncharacterized protein n=1 Tax=Plakobranchus ocellatus TaxID=259542 RepID=A0AAV4BGH1_9GAST|nr:hypothetical protein PoB_004569400 [Plakobranchus ocellatus]
MATIPKTRKGVKSDGGVLHLTSSKAQNSTLAEVSREEKGSGQSKTVNASNKYDCGTLVEAACRKSVKFVTESIVKQHGHLSPSGRRNLTF